METAFQAGREIGRVLAVAFIRCSAGVHRQVFAGEGAQVLIFVTFGIPDHPRTTDPLRQDFGLFCGRISLVADTGQHASCPDRAVRVYGLLQRIT